MIIITRFYNCGFAIQNMKSSRKIGFSEKSAALAFVINLVQQFLFLFQTNRLSYTSKNDMS